MSEPKVVGINRTSDTDEVVTVEGGDWSFRRAPCKECPWRRSSDGSFSAAAFRHSASTSYDLAESTFACHMAGVKQPATCAGFLLSTSAEHNLSVRMKIIGGVYSHDQVQPAGADLHPNYRSMAIANGVDPDDPAIRPCR